MSKMSEIDRKTEIDTDDYEIGPYHCGTINLLYSPESNDLLESLEYPNQFWHEDEEGKHRLFIMSVHPEVRHTKYYLIGVL